MNITCQECEELSGAFVLDAVTPEEHKAVEAHIAGCAKCSLNIKELREVVSLLPLAVPQVKPRKSLWQRILQAIRDTLR